MTGDTRTTGSAPLEVPTAPARDLTRRRALGLAAAVGAAGLLAACGGGDDTSDTADTSDPPATGESGSATTGGSAEPSAGGGEALVKTADVPVAGGVILRDQKVVVTQPSAGQFKAFSAVCTHQSCLVSHVAEGAIICDCHFSAFKITDGSPTENPEKKRPGPAGRPLSEVKVAVSGDSVVEA